MFFIHKVTLFFGESRSVGREEKKVSIPKITFTASYSQGVKNIKKKRLKSLNNGIKGVVLHPQ
jgi:hypothetical protein